ncbi:hypothetical protein AYJ54_37570 [Bradyrhizobium centrolobii]|uniref:Uncharacterized protein n=1 Tax=Bradyrhizobium centrolobii TaxID=1505087 RepID=A0A176Z848_9BRAD|nr:hypothetical protein AYJ54_37570 [Bradyrhizobium centrolobii]
MIQEEGSSHSLHRVGPCGLTERSESDIARQHLRPTKTAADTKRRAGIASLLTIAVPLKSFETG